MRFMMLMRSRAAGRHGLSPLKYKTGCQSVCSGSSLEVPPAPMSIHPVSAGAGGHGPKALRRTGARRARPYEGSCASFVEGSDCVRILLHGIELHLNLKNALFLRARAFSPCRHLRLRCCLHGCFYQRTAPGTQDHHLGSAKRPTMVQRQSYFSAPMYLPPTQKRSNVCSTCHTPSHTEGRRSSLCSAIAEERKQGLRSAIRHSCSEKATTIPSWRPTKQASPAR